MDYLVGDVQGCCDAFERLLAEIGFSPSRDHLVLVGDLVNRGPDSLGTLKRLRATTSENPLKTSRQRKRPGWRPSCLLRAVTTRSERRRSLASAINGS